MSKQKKQTDWTRRICLAIFIPFAIAAFAIHAFGVSTNYTIRELLPETADTAWVYLSDTTGAITDTFALNGDSAAVGVLYGTIQYDDEKTQKAHVWIDYGADSSSYSILFLSSAIQSATADLLLYELLQPEDTFARVILYEANSLVDTTAASADSLDDRRLYAVVDYDGSVDNRFLVEILSSDGTFRSYSEDYFSGSCTTLVVPNGDTNKTLLAFDINTPDGSAVDSAKVYLNLKSEGDSVLSVGDFLVISEDERNREIYGQATSAGLYTIALYPNEIFTNDSSWYEVSIFTKRGSRILLPTKFRLPDADSTVWFHNLTRWR